MCVSVESACISSVILSSINLLFHSLYYVHSQIVSCCLVPCFKFVFLLKVHVFLFIYFSIHLLLVIYMCTKFSESEFCYMSETFLFLEDLNSK